MNDRARPVTMVKLKHHEACRAQRLAAFRGWRAFQRLTETFGNVKGRRHVFRRPLLGYLAYFRKRGLSAALGLWEAAFHDARGLVSPSPPPTSIPSSFAVIANRSWASAM